MSKQSSVFTFFKLLKSKISHTEITGTTKIIESDDIDDFHDLLLPYVGQQGGEIQVSRRTDYVQKRS